MNNKSIKINAVLNVIRSCLSIIFPLVTAPYVFRVLGAVGIGKVSYVNSIVSYFSLFAMLGVSTYAVREGAKRRTDKAELNQFISEVFTINIITTGISCSIMFLTVYFVDKLYSYRSLFLILGFSIVFQTFSVDWLNTVFEDYLYITIRTIIVYTVHLLLIFIFINDEGDYYLYAFLQILSSGIICFSNWFYCRRYAQIRLTRIENTKKHIRPLLILFSNAVMVSVYVNFDTTMLGWFQNDHAVGLYSASVKVYSVVKTLMVAIYSVTIPRLARLYGQKDDEGFKNLYSNLWAYIILILLPASTGIVCLAREIIMFMGGEKFVEATLSLQILGLALSFAIVGGLVTSCLNITIGREKDNLIATIFSATLNFILNLFFIPRWSLTGAAMTTLISEAFVFLFCFLRIPNKTKYIDRRTISINIGHALLGIILIVVVSTIIHSMTDQVVVTIIGVIFISLAGYSVILYICKNAIFISELNRIKQRRRIEK